MLALPYEERYAEGLLLGSRSAFVVRRCNGDPDFCLTVSYSDAAGEAVSHARICSTGGGAGAGARLRLELDGEELEGEHVEELIASAFIGKGYQPASCCAKYRQAI